MKYLIWIVVAVVVAAGGYYWWKQQHPDAPPIATAPAPAVSTEPEIAHPLDPAAVADAALPALAESDAAAQDALKGLVGGDSLALFYLKDIIRRIVATIDNLPRERLAQRLMPLKPVPGSFVANTATDTPEIAAANAKRYAPYVHAIDAVDAQQLVAIYLHFYPLFQQAYQDLGYPNGYFNDRLIAVIDNLLATPELSQPIKLQRPESLYQFADPELEARPAGQKILLRMGSDNAATVKKKLQQIRDELIAREKKSDSSNSP